MGAEKEAFHLSASHSYSSGNTGATIVSPAPAVVPAKAATSSATAASSTASADEKKALAAALKANQAATPPAVCKSLVGTNTADGSQAAHGWYIPADRYQKNCAGSTCSATKWEEGLPPWHARFQVSLLMPIAMLSN